MTTINISIDKCRSVICNHYSTIVLSSVLLLLLLFVILTPSFANIPLKTQKQTLKIMMIINEIESYSKKTQHANEYWLWLFFFQEINSTRNKWERQRTKNQHTTRSTQWPVNVSDVQWSKRRKRKKEKQQKISYSSFFLVCPAQLTMNLLRMFFPPLSFLRCTTYSEREWVTSALLGSRWREICGTRAYTTLQIHLCMSTSTLEIIIPLSLTSIYFIMYNWENIQSWFT
jgi:hypothetical protein